jgi:predicted component of type VI protein secretion system
MDAIMATTIKTLIEQVIKNHEPRANLLDVIVKPDYDNQAYEVTILFAMINIPDPVQLSLKLSRIR